MRWISYYKIMIWINLHELLLKHFYSSKVSGDGAALYSLFLSFISLHPTLRLIMRHQAAGSGSPVMQSGQPIRRASKKTPHNLWSRGSFNQTAFCFQSYFLLSFFSFYRTIIAPFQSKRASSPFLKLKVCVYLHLAK